MSSMSTQPAQLQKIIYFSACREQKYNFFQTILANNALKSRKLYKFVASNPYNTLYIMSQETHNKAEYIVIFISEFARHYGLSAVQAYRYLKYRNCKKTRDFLRKSLFFFPISLPNFSIVPLISHQDQFPLLPL